MEGVLSRVKIVLLSVLHLHAHSGQTQGMTSQSRSSLFKPIFFIFFFKIMIAVIFLPVSNRDFLFVKIFLEPTSVRHFEFKLHGNCLLLNGPLKASKLKLMTETL